MRRAGEGRLVEKGPVPAISRSNKERAFAF